MRDDLVKKFEALRELRQKTCQRSSQLRQINLKKQALSTALAALPRDSVTADDVRALYARTEEEHAGLCPWKKKKQKCVDPKKASNDQSTPVGKGTHLLEQGPSLSHSKGLQKSSLEWHLDEAISEGKSTLAEQLSDLIQENRSRENTYGSIPTDSKRLRETSFEQENQRKRKRPHWTFEPKQRWETKSKM